MRWNIAFDYHVQQTDILKELINIEAYKNFVQEIPLPPSIRERVDRLNIIRAIRGTTGIEGNSLNEEEVKKIITDKTAPNRKISLEEQEVINAKNVLEFIRSLPPGENILISEVLIQRIHDITTTKCYYENNIPGKYGNHEVRAGDYDCPDHADIPFLMKQFIEYINSKRSVDLHPAIRAILAHFYLISIHPFGDGNGRTSRGLEAFILYNGGYYNALGFYSLANFYYRKRSKYVEELQNARFMHRGNLTKFIRFSLTGLVEELEGIKKIVLDFYRELSYCDFMNELEEKGTIKKRVSSLLKFIAKTSNGLPLKQLSSIPLAMGLYKNLSSRTLRADLTNVKKLKLIIVDEGIISANLSIMDDFAPIH